MTDRVLLSAGPDNIDACLALAAERKLGIELMTFAYPHILDGNWQQTVARYRALLAGVHGMISLHGPFFDMSPGSIDERVKSLTFERYEHAIRIAGELRAAVVVFHANFIAAIRSQEYRQSWQARNVEFWGRLGDYAQQHNVTVAIENMWEFHPAIIGDVLREVGHARVRACLDVGHAHLYSDVPFEDWLTTLSPYIVHLHLNNNPGHMDQHQSLHEGALDYRALLPRLRQMTNGSTFTLEMDTVQDMAASLDLLELT